MYDMPDREPEPVTWEQVDNAKADPGVKPYLGGRCRLCERYAGGPATGYRHSETTRMCSTGRPRPDHQVALPISSVTFCTCTLGRWMRSKELERRQGKSERKGAA